MALAHDVTEMLTGLWLRLVKVGFLNWVLVVSAVISALYTIYKWRQERESQTVQRLADALARTRAYSALDEAAQHVNSAREDFRNLKKIAASPEDTVGVARTRLRLIAASVSNVDLARIDEVDQQSAKAALDQITLFEAEVSNLIENLSLVHRYEDRARLRHIEIKKFWPPQTVHAEGAT